MYFASINYSNNSCPNFGTLSQFEQFLLLDRKTRCFQGKISPKKPQYQNTQKKNPGQLAPTGIFFSQIRSAPCYSALLFHLYHLLRRRVCRRLPAFIHNTARSDTTKTYPFRTYFSALLSLPYRSIRQQYPLRTVIRIPSPSLHVFLTDNQFPQRIPTS